MKKLKVLFIPTSNSGVVFWRMYNFWVSSSRQGIADMPVLWWKKDLTEVHPWERDIINPEHKYRITGELLAMARLSDVIVFQMLHGPGFKNDTFLKTDEDYITHSMADFRTLKDMFPNIPIFSEIDDNMLSTPEYNPAIVHYGPKQPLRELAITQFRESDGLIVSTQGLAEVYSHLNDNIIVVPNAIDFQVWNHLNRHPKKGIRIGWAGGANHGDDLEILRNIVPRITEKHKDVKFVFVHGCPEWLRNMPNVEYIAKWTDIDKYPRLLSSLDFDIGIAPLVDNAFNRGKSNLRWLEYSALRIPTVASNVGPFKESIKDGIDGLLADDETQFYSCLELLITNKKLRKDMGKIANERVKKDFNLDSVTKYYVESLQKVFFDASKLVAA